MLSFDSSIPTESASDTESSLGDSDGREQFRPSSPEVVFIGNTDDDGSEEETISVTGFSKSDTEGVCVAAAREKAHLGDVLYAAWHDNQIHKGNDKIRQRDSRVCDHPQFGKRCEVLIRSDLLFPTWRSTGFLSPWSSQTIQWGCVGFTIQVHEKANVLVGRSQPRVLIGFVV